MDESPVTQTPQEALSLAVTRIGGQSALARLCDVSQSTVWEWLDRGKEIPAEHVLKVEAATHVSRCDLRPDLYPRGLQDGVPFRADDGAAPMGELAAGGPPEWPIAGRNDDGAENGNAGISERSVA